MFNHKIRVVGLVNSTQQISDYVRTLNADVEVVTPVYIYVGVNGLDGLAILHGRGVADATPPGCLFHYGYEINLGHSGYPSLPSMECERLRDRPSMRSLIFVQYHSCGVFAYVRGITDGIGRLIKIYLKASTSWSSFSS